MGDKLLITKVTGTIHATFYISELAIQEVSVKQQFRVSSSRGGSSVTEADLNVHKITSVISYKCMHT